MADKSPTLDELLGRVPEKPSDRRWRLFALGTRLLVYAAVLALLSFNFPDRIAATPLGLLTLSDLAWVAIYTLWCVAVVAKIFFPPRDHAARELWGSIGILMLWAIPLVVAGALVAAALGFLTLPHFG